MRQHRMVSDAHEPLTWRRIASDGQWRRLSLVLCTLNESAPCRLGGGPKSAQTRLGLMVPAASRTLCGSSPTANLVSNTQGKGRRFDSPKLKKRCPASAEGRARERS